MPKYYLIPSVLLMLLPILSKAQIDPQFSQYYAAPLYLNPAFAGSSQFTRIGAIYRNQWPAISANFITYSAFADNYFEDYNSGLGFYVLADQEGTMGARSTEIALQYAYQLEISESLTFRPGFESALFIRDINFNRLIFPEQIDQGGANGNPHTEPIGSGETRVFGDISAGGLLYSRNFWAGIAVHHLTSPNTSLVGGESRLPRKYSVQAGYRFLLSHPTYYNGFTDDGRERSITPTFNYKAQGGYDQLDIGAYLTYEPIMFGLWYRGVPYKSYEGFGNNEAIVMMVGFSMDNLRIGYSFDYTISRLGIGAGGAHEISINYIFNTNNPRKPPKNVRRIPCPKM